MINTYLTSQPGTAEGIAQLLAAMQDFRNQLLFVLKVNHPRNHYSFVAVFREKGTVGGFTALVDQEGATSGYSGGGPYAYAQVMTFLEENQIPVEEAYWSNWETDYSEFTTKIEALGMSGNYTGELAQIWSSFLSYYIWDLLPGLRYQPSEKWLRQATQE